MPPESAAGDGAASSEPIPQMPPPMQPVQSPVVTGGDFDYPNAPLTYTAAQLQVSDGKRPALKVPTWGLGDVWITLALLMIFQIAAVIAIAVVYAVVAPHELGESGMPKSILVSLGLTIVMWAGMGLWPWFAAKSKGNGIRIDFGLRASWRDVGLGILYGLLSFVVAVVLALVSQHLWGEFSSAAADEAAGYRDSVLHSFLFSLAIAFGAPFFEELAFRGLFLSSLAKRGMGAILSIAIPALVFSLMHFEPKRILLLFGVGCVFGLARWQSKSLTTSVVAHMCNNLPGAIGILLLSMGISVPL